MFFPVDLVYKVMYYAIEDVSFEFIKFYINYLVTFCNIKSF